MVDIRHGRNSYHDYSLDHNFHSSCAIGDSESGKIITERIVIKSVGEKIAWNCVGEIISVNYSLSTSSKNESKLLLFSDILYGAIHFCYAFLQHNVFSARIASFYTAIISPMVCLCDADLSDLFSNDPEILSL